MLSIMRLLLVVFGFLAGVVHAATLEGKAINVADGDTITLLDAANKQYKIRIGGIDAPERKQPYSNRSKQHLADMVHGKEVAANCLKTDRYGRQVCKVWVRPSDCPKCGKTLDVGHAQIVAGLAWWYRAYAKEQSAEDQGRYESAEQEAKNRKIGLWQDKNPVAPWDWRRKSK